LRSSRRGATRRDRTGGHLAQGFQREIENFRIRGLAILASEILHAALQKFIGFAVPETKHWAEIRISACGRISRERQMPAGNRNRVFGP
jgi:hypothetical protein